jgi:hypothetical protein
VLDNTETEVDEQLEKALEVIANMIWHWYSTMINWV